MLIQLKNRKKLLKTGWGGQICIFSSVWSLSKSNTILPCAVRMSIQPMHCEWLKERNCAWGTGKSSFMIFNQFGVSVIMIKQTICKFDSNKIIIIIRWIISSHYTEQKSNFKILFYGFPRYGRSQDLYNS